MDEVSRTLEAYESNAEAYVRKYRSQSAAALYGDPFFDALAGDRVLDVGCGPGSDLETFAADGYEAVGLDPTESFLRAARDRGITASLARGDMRELPFGDATFDGVWSSASFLHVPRSEAVPTLREIRRILRPDGVFFCSVKREPTTAAESRTRHFEYYRPDTIRALLADAGFDPEIIECTERWVALLAEAESFETNR